MLYYLFASDPNSDLYINIFRYLTFRSGSALITALAVALIIAPSWIEKLRKRQLGKSTIREYLTVEHAHKEGTPSMGGSIIIFSIFVSSVLWIDLTNLYCWLTLASLGVFGFLGYIDDKLKLSTKGKRAGKGLASKQKFALQVGLSFILAIAYLLISPDELSTVISIPFFKNLQPDIGIGFFIIWQILVITGSSNAVNLTDGLDGLAIVPSIIVAGTFALIVYLVGNSVYAEYLRLIYVPGTGELAIICAAIIGSGLGFLWFNSPPAQIYMGDSGALALGASLGVMAIASKHELVLVLAGGLFVLETVSVIVQVVSYKLIGKRIFAMAPLHHHFEKKGWAESTIVIRFWIISFVLALSSLATLKLR